MQICLGRCHIVIRSGIAATSSSHSTSSQTSSYLSLWDWHLHHIQHPLQYQHQHQDVLSPGLGLGVRSSTLHPPAFGIPVPFATRQIWVQDPPRNTHTQIHIDAHSTNYPWTAKSVTKLISSNLLIVYHCTLETRWAPRIFTCGLLIGPNPVQVSRVLRANR